MKRLFYMCNMLVILCAFGCAHKITITPHLDKLEAGVETKINKNVGYYISPENFEKKVVTPAGGGDKVKYYPYKESEPALRSVLDNIFSEVYLMPSLEDKDFLILKDISFIFVPEIETDSSSRSFWIWPPSDFSVSLNCRAIDELGNIIWEDDIRGEAHLGLPQVHMDHSLAGRLATEKVFMKLQSRILESEIFR